MNILPIIRIARGDVRVFSISLLISTYSLTYALLIFLFDPLYPWGPFLNWFIFKMSVIVRWVAKLLFAYRKKRNNHSWGPPRKNVVDHLVYQKCLFLNHLILWCQLNSAFCEQSIAQHVFLNTFCCTENAENESNLETHLRIWSVSYPDWIEILVTVWS